MKSSESRRPAWLSSLLGDCAVWLRQMRRLTLLMIITENLGRCRGGVTSVRGCTESAVASRQRKRPELRRQTESRQHSSTSRISHNIGL